VGAPPLNQGGNATGLRTVLRRGDLGAELPHLAVFDRRYPDPKQKYATDHYQKMGGSYADPHKNP